MTAIQERPATDARNLIVAKLRATLVSNVQVKFPELTDDEADRGVGQMVAFLAAGAYSDTPLSLSPLVDDFWHAFLLHTQAYQDFCSGTIGKFVHHQPGFLDKEEHSGSKAIRGSACGRRAAEGRGAGCGRPLRRTAGGRPPSRHE
ncbi:glycine-rich domain-containing protein [Streptomyces vinaceus]|uniref:hypothetical protein n=1 Tax=Streptomyces vinaceus TaxID=1960 RepID=UPI00367C770F